MTLQVDPKPYSEYTKYHHTLLRQSIMSLAQDRHDKQKKMWKHPTPLTQIVLHKEDILKKAYLKIKVLCKQNEYPYNSQPYDTVRCNPVAERLPHAKIDCYPGPCCPKKLTLKRRVEELRELGFLKFLVKGSGAYRLSEDVFEVKTR